MAHVALLASHFDLRVKDCIEFEEFEGTKFTRNTVAVRL